MELEAVFDMFDQLGDAVFIIGKDSVIEYAGRPAFLLFNQTKANLTGMRCNL